MLVSWMGCSGRGGRGHFVYGGVPSVTRTVAGEGVAVFSPIDRGGIARRRTRLGGDLRLKWRETVIPSRDPEGIELGEGKGEERRGGREADREFSSGLWDVTMTRRSAGTARIKRDAFPRGFRRSRGRGMEERGHWERNKRHWGRIWLGGGERRGGKRGRGEVMMLDGAKSRSSGEGGKECT